MRTLCAMLIVQRPLVEALGDDDHTSGRFAIGPLEPGFGYTLGNSLRRTLLSSIPGAAVTQVRFDDALHEFSTLPGVKEDVTDIILNLKDLVLTMESDEPVTLRLDVRGAADVTAGDIQTTADVEILNPELHVATLNAKGRLAVDITVERGRGYVSADRNKKSSTIGVIPVDSIFSPVRRVAFTVEPTRVEQSTNYDRLVLDIDTDGSITPREALASAGDTLRSLVGLVADMSEAPQGLELGEVAGERSGSPDLDLPIEDLDLSERPRNCLKRAQVNSIGELVEKTEEDLLAITNFGQKSLDEVIQKLDERGLSLRRRVDSVPAVEQRLLELGEATGRKWATPDDSAIIAVIAVPDRSVTWTTRRQPVECVELVTDLLSSRLVATAELPLAYATVLTENGANTAETHWEINTPAEFQRDAWYSIEDASRVSLVRLETRDHAWVWERVPGTDLYSFGVIFSDAAPPEAKRALERTWSHRWQHASPHPAGEVIAYAMSKK